MDGMTDRGRFAGRPRPIGMTARAVSLACVALAGTAVAKDRRPLPLIPGTYVATDTACEDPPLAAIMTYDGIGLGGAHASACRSRVTGRKGRAIVVRTTCRANGDGSPATPSTVTETLRLISTRNFGIVAPGETAPDRRYRLCPPPGIGAHEKPRQPIGLTG